MDEESALLVWMSEYTLGRGIWRSGWMQERSREVLGNVGVESEEGKQWCKKWMQCHRKCAVRGMGVAWAGGQEDYKNEKQTRVFKML